eukprot:6191910-Pleurochrysis_carterae.AAC.2
MTSAYRLPPSCDGRKGPAMSTWTSRPGWLAHASQAAGEALDRLAGASAVSEGRLRRRAAPTCNLRCMCLAASSPGITWMCEDARAECIASTRAD